MAGVFITERLANKFVLILRPRIPLPERSTTRRYCLVRPDPAASMSTPRIIRVQLHELMFGNGRIGRFICWSPTKSEGGIDREYVDPRIVRVSKRR
jgi:hypothetical protein